MIVPLHLTQHKRFVLFEGLTQIAPLTLRKLRIARRPLGEILLERSYIRHIEYLA